MALPQEIPVEFIIRGTEAAELTVEEFANFLRDIVFLHDRLWLIESRTFREYDLGASFFYTRNGRPIPKDQRLELISAHKGSPFELRLRMHWVVGTATAAWLFFQLIRGIALFPGEIRLEKLQEKELTQEISEIEDRKEEVTQAMQQLHHELEDLPAMLRMLDETKVDLVRRDVERLLKDRPVITEVEITKTAHVAPESDDKR